ncbi:MAG: hypothetical protein GQE15_39780 [Archangiaceae bacterium]|nr:hypothetical protein [Archangiaceae bacterium]
MEGLTMADTKGFTSLTAARVRAATHILSIPDLLALYIGLGGLADDLEAVRDAGLEAEGFNQLQGSMLSTGKTATASVGVAFSTLQREYLLLLAVLRAIRGQLLRADPRDENAARLADIIANRAQLTVIEAKEEGGARKATKSRSQEATRAEIERDAVDLIDFSAMASTLAARGWNATRLNKLRNDAKALSGKLGDRAVSKGAAKEATKSEREAVTRQSAAWDSAYSLLRTLARKDTRVAALLAEARR